MVTRYDKAVAATIGTALTSVLIAILPETDPKLVGSIGTIVTAFLTWLVPNS